jgi:hypothetical protein
MLGSVLLLALHGRVYINYYADDAFISFRYAQNWADGFGPNWNPGEARVEGYTGILWLLPLAGAARIGLDIPETARYLGFACSIGTLALLYPLSRELPGGRELPLAPVLAGLALAAASPFATWTFAGMEMPLFVLLVVLGVWLHLREDAWKSALPWSAPVFALAMATRPEGAIFVAVTGLFKLASLASPQERLRRLVQIALWGGVILVLYGAYFLWRYEYYGYLLPNTFYAKMDTGADIYRRGLSYLADAGATYGIPLLVMGLLLYWAQARPSKPAGYLVAMTAAWLCWVVMTGGDPLVRLRFLVPILPVLCIGTALGGLLILRSALANPTPAARPALALLFAALLLATAYPSLQSGLLGDRDVHTKAVTIGRWMHESLPPDTRIAMTRAGAIPFYSGLPALDMLGLNDTHIAHADIQLGHGWTGHEKYDIDYVLEQQPDVIVMGTLSPAPLTTAEQYAQTSFPFPAQQGLVADPRTFQDYYPVAIDLTGENGWLNMLVAKQGANDVWLALVRQDGLTIDIYRAQLRYVIIPRHEAAWQGHGSSLTGPVRRKPSHRQ